MLSRQLEGRELQLSAKLAELGVRGSALDARGVMSRPDRLLFEDARGFYRKFRLLSQCVISREVDTLPALTAAGVDHDVVVYPGAPHSFFDRAHGDFAAECTDAWRRTLAFLASVG